MTKEQAEALACIYDLCEVSTIDDQLVVIRRNHDGSRVVFFADSVREFRTDNALAANRPSKIIPLFADYSDLIDEIFECRESDQVTEHPPAATPTDLSTVFPLVLYPTYYGQGFFNVPVTHDGFVCEHDGVVEIVLGEGLRISARVNRTANTNGTARIMGGKHLRDWFSENCQLMQPVYVDLVMPSEIRITLEPPQSE